ncbi:GtrA family protein [Actinomadura logoneensis]|uniref:GtrA family protein n=1 Tax=Actinomadura logoneensis TaxID=2293572 RepID=UPI001F46122C|nr:GtrA family protein [Actinomadura logoneensis]
MSFVANLYRRFAHIVHELAKFGSIGALAFVITTGLGNLLHVGFGVGELTSTGVGTVVAATFAYLANRYWTFRHREQSGMGREYVTFFVLNGVGLLITWLIQGFVKFALDQRGWIAYNASLVVGTGVATLFRYWAYKKWVFLPEGAPPVTAGGLPDPAAARAVQDGAPTGASTPLEPSRTQPEGMAEFSRTPLNT